MSFGSLFLASATLIFIVLILAIFDGYVNSAARSLNLGRGLL
jgi:hypothetical protein